MSAATDSSPPQVSLLIRARQLALTCVALLLLVALVALLRSLWRELPAPILPDESALSVSSYQGYAPLTAELQISQRPLFWQERRPLAEEVEVVEPEPEPEVNRNIDKFQLLGLFGAGENASAIVMYKKEKHRLRLGDTLDGWTLMGVVDNSALFTSAGSDVPESKVLYEPVLLQQHWPGGNSPLQNQSDF